MQRETDSSACLLDPSLSSVDQRFEAQEGTKEWVPKVLKKQKKEEEEVLAHSMQGG